MIDKDVEAKLNEQVNHEIGSAYNYLAMSAHFETAGLKGFAKWMFMQREEELVHAAKLIKYVVDRGGGLDLAAIPKPRRDFKTVQEAFENSLDLEQRNTKVIHELYALAEKKKDYATKTFLHWFILEQVEEERLVEEALSLVKIAADNRSALLVLNAQMGERTLGGGKAAGGE